MTPLQLVQVGEIILLSSRIDWLRERFPQLHFTECSEDDVSPRHQPALSFDNHDLYLVTGATGECLKLTNDFNKATGVLVAAKADAD